MVGEQERIEIGKEEEKGLVRLLLFALGRAGCSLGWVGILGGGGRLCAGEIQSLEGTEMLQ